MCRALDPGAARKFLPEYAALPSGGKGPAHSVTLLPAFVARRDELAEKRHEKTSDCPIGRLRPRSSMPVGGKLVLKGGLHVGVEKKKKKKSKKSTKELTEEELATKSERGKG